MSRPGKRLSREAMADLAVAQIVDIMRGTCKLMETEIAKNVDDPALIHLLTGLLYLSQDLELERKRTLGLNEELASRIETLEQRDRENTVLTNELRRQIGHRAAQLSDALTRLTSATGDHALAPGDEILERYRVARVIGAGAMGDVYEVLRMSDERRFALKVMRKGGASVETLARFAREAQIAAQVTHPNLVAIVDIDVAAFGALYLVLELVDGSSLEEMRERFGDGAWALPILAQVAAGLAALHDTGIVHRDLKPANVLHADGVAKIADFGVASLRLARADTLTPAVSRSIARDRLTRVGQVIGTPLYIAPEQASGGAVGPAVDVWSFGVLAHELLTGHLPFIEPPLYASLEGRSPIIRPLPLPVPDAAQALVTRCLSLDPTERPSAHELAGIAGAAAEPVADPKNAALR
jgi:serine/threonine-protein kinase